MPFYFDTSFAATTNGSGSTETTHLSFLTAANKNSAKIMSLLGCMLFGTAGGAKLRLKTADTTPASGGTTQTPGPRHPDQPASDLTVKNSGSAITPGSTLKQRLAVGLAQTGSQGGWCAMEDAAAVHLNPNGGVKGNAEVSSIANGTSVAVDITVEHKES